MKEIFELPSGATATIRFLPPMKKELDTYAKGIYVVDYMDRIRETDVNSDAIDAFMKMFETINPKRGANLGEKLGIL